MTKQTDELQKVKELNEYLMNELLTIFEKIKQFELFSESIKKTAPSQETVTSLVFDHDHFI